MKPLTILDEVKLSDETWDQIIEIRRRDVERTDIRARMKRGHNHILGLLTPIPGERARARRIEEMLAA